MSERKASKHGRGTDLAYFLRERGSDILAEWEAAARARVRSANLPKPQLLNFLPELISQIADLVEQLQTGRSAELSEPAAERHALDRLGEGFDLPEVVKELSLLRVCILRLWHDALGPSREGAEERILSEAVDRVIFFSVERYTQARDRILRALDRVSSTALEAQSLDSLLHQLISTFREEVPAVDTVALLLREGDVVRVRAASGLEEDISIGFSMRTGEGFAGKIAAEKQPLQLRSAASDPIVKSDVIRSKGVKALYGVPLIDEGELIGVAHMGSLTAEEFSDQDRVLFASMASRATAGIYHQMLRDKAEKRARELEASEQRFQATFENAAVGSAHIALDGTWLRLNRKYCQILGYTHDELTKLRFQDVTYPDDLDSDLENLQRVRAGESDGYTMEKRYIRRDGEVVWVDLAVGVVRDAEARPLYLVATARDITIRKRTEAALQRALEEAEAARRLLDALMESIPVGITIADAPDARIRAVSRYGRELSGRPSESLEGIEMERHAECWGVLRADGTPARSEDLPLTRATQKGEHVREEEWLLLRPDGTRVPILCTAGPITDRRGEIVGGVVGFQDITEKKKAEALLLEREERLRLVIDATGIGAFDFYPSTGRLEWSVHIKAHFGLPPGAEVDYGVFLRGLHPEDRERVDRLVQDALRPESGGGYATEYRTIGIEDGQERWIAARGQVTFDESGKPVRFVGVTLDISDRKRAEEQLRESDRRKDEFLAILGHELRNPLAAIRNASELMKLTAPEDGRLQRAQGVLDRQTAHMTRLIDGLLEVSRIAQGKLHLEPEMLDARKVVEGVMQDRSAEIEARGLELESDLPPNPVWVWGDQVRLAQILDNLIGNAVKFTEPPGRIEVLLQEDEGRALILVRDTGIGIRPEMLDRLFNPFQQEVQDIARAAGGLGLGLAVAKGLVELHGGTIRAHSAGPGSGAAFEVCLPLGNASQEAPRASEAVAVASRRILIVEDNRDAADMLRDLLELRGHEVKVVDVGEEALESLRSGGVDVVLCDLGLPGMTGHDVARAVRSDSELCETPLVALTGYGQPEDRRRTEEAGFDAHLTKPVDLEALDMVLRGLRRDRA